MDPTVSLKKFHLQCWAG